MKWILNLIIITIVVFITITFYLTGLIKEMNVIDKYEKNLLREKETLFWEIHNFNKQSIEINKKRIEKVILDKSSFIDEEKGKKIIELMEKNISKNDVTDDRIYQLISDDIENSLVLKNIEKNEKTKKFYIAKYIRDIVVPLILIVIIGLLLRMYKKREYEIEVLKKVIDKLSDKDCNYIPIYKINSKVEILINDLKTFKKNMIATDDMIKIMLRENGLEDTLRVIFDNNKLKEYIGFNRLGFAKIDGEDVVAALSFSESKESYLPVGYRLGLDKSSLRYLLENREIRIINDLEEYLLKNKNSKSTEFIIKEGFKSSMTMPLVKNDGVTVGFLFFSSFKKNGFDENAKLRAKSIAEIFSYIFEKNIMIEDMVTNTAFSFVKLVEGKDPETGDHIERMAKYAEIIAKKCADIYPEWNITHGDIEKIRKFAPLHDIGKVGIPDEILLKPGKLTPEEFDIMKKHTVIGADVINRYQQNLKKYNYDFLETGYDIALYHHEKWNGKGYPEALSGNDIPIVARIVSVADVFDALSSKRVYKKAFSFEDSIEMIKEMSGESFQPEIVNAFIESLKDIRHIYETQNKK